MEGDADLIALYGSDGATVTFTAMADEDDEWWTPNHNSKGLIARLGFWRDLYGSERVIEITQDSIRSALETYGRPAPPHQPTGYAPAFPAYSPSPSNSVTTSRQTPSRDNRPH